MITSANNPNANASSSYVVTAAITKIWSFQESFVIKMVGMIRMKSRRVMVESKIPQHHEHRTHTVAAEHVRKRAMSKNTTMTSVRNKKVF